MMMDFAILTFRWRGEKQGEGRGDWGRREIRGGLLLGFLLAEAEARVPAGAMAASPTSENCGVAA